MDIVEMVQTNGMGQIINTGLLGKIDQITLSERAKSVRNQYFSATPGVAAERAVLATESWKETEGEHITLRRAKLFEKVLNGIPIVMFPGQLLVGSETKYFRGSHPQVDFDGCFLIPLLAEEEGKLTLGGPVEKGLVPKEDWDNLIKVAQFWKGRTAVERARELGSVVMGSWYDDLVEAGVPRYDWKAQLPGAAPLFDRVVSHGLRDFVTKAEEMQRAWVERQEHDFKKLYFWQAAIRCSKAVINLAHRYAGRLREMAAAEKDPDWRKELEEMAQICEWVPENPARTFREALQSIVFIHLAIKLEAPQYPPTGWRLMDQYLYPYFKKDLEEGRLSLDKAVDLLSDFVTYNARQEWIAEISWRDYLQKGAMNNIGLAGTNGKGEEISNELTYLILHVAGLTGYAEPHFTLRWTKDTPHWIMRKAMETNIKVKGGVPQFQNGDTTVEYMVKRGVSPENAYGWVTHGCSQALPADEGTSMATDYLNVPLCVDLTLHDGIASKTGKQIGLKTGDPRNFKTYDEFYNAFKKQVEYVFTRQMWYDNLVDQAKAEFYGQPFASTVMLGCLEKGMDFGQGGLNHYRITLRKDRGLVSAADSLTAIKELVYTRNGNKLTMEALLRAVDSNFEGKLGEEIRQMCLAAPKYGNDVDEPDFILRDVAKFTASVIQSHKNIWGFPYAINRNGQSWHFFGGKRLAALPNGRKSGEPLADGSLSPSQGLDSKGVTATLNSALKSEFKNDSLFGVLNIKFPSSLLQMSESQDKVIGLIENFFKAGGTYIQFNIMDAKTLREAKSNPEKYRDLVVRVGGYSAYFVTLSPEVQDEIIKRTEHAL
ncbi:MAG: hypothetical protein HY525_20935 [Betaproteobacteria bacterium]|nr:hypothetical protein [Betaproteobacteria bacterium]